MRKINVNKIIKELIDYLGIILFFLFILSGAKYDFLFYSSLLFFGLVLFKEEYGWLHIIYIMILSAILVLIPYFFREYGKIIMYIVFFIIAVFLGIRKIKKGESIW